MLRADFDRDGSGQEHVKEGDGRWMLTISFLSSNFLPVLWRGEPSLSANRLRRSGEIQPTISLFRMIRGSQDSTHGCSGRAGRGGSRTYLKERTSLSINAILSK